MLRIALDVTPLLGERTGIGVAVAGFAHALAARDEVELRGYGLTVRGWRRVGLSVPDGAVSVARPAPAGALLRLWSRGDWPPGEWWTGRADVVHGSNFVVPPERRAARLVSVWDMTPVRYPQLCTPTSRRYPALVARAVAAGAWVHTGSRSAAEEIVDHFAIEPERVRVVAPAVIVPTVAGPAAGPSCETAEPAPPYILGLGRTEPRKDFPGLVRAFDRLAGCHPELELTIAGPPGWGEQELSAAVAASPFRRRIRRLGWTDDVATLIGRARVFAYPSVYEGFGLPPLEAMALGVPVVATATGAIPEVAGEAALLVPPGDPDALAGALHRVLTEPALRRALAEAGPGRAAHFDLRRAGEGLIETYLAMTAPP